MKSPVAEFDSHFAGKLGHLRGDCQTPSQDIWDVDKTLNSDEYIAYTRHIVSLALEDWTAAGRCRSINSQWTPRNSKRQHLYAEHEVVKSHRSRRTIAQGTRGFKLAYRRAPRRLTDCSHAKQVPAPRRRHSSDPRVDAAGAAGARTTEPTLNFITLNEYEYGATSPERPMDRAALICRRRIGDDRRWMRSRGRSCYWSSFSAEVTIVLLMRSDLCLQSEKAMVPLKEVSCFTKPSKLFRS
ncbi:hypothetical protein EVAR_59176_1 [Eumeta japonica]|uniref:Uncharacterized protein n=1 Tax=Eumeta variegata TaxID=151549 RepID=A0A4C1ZK09_EUMVA|nr:hypothetical protein EVAR_59176_1 [Eumeta japonica]